MVKLLPHQVEALSKSINKEAFGFFMDMGTGKTRTALELIYYKCFFKVLVVIRKDDFFTWEKEIKLYTDYSYIRIDSALDLHSDVRLYFINYDRFKTFKKQIYDIQFDCIILDEASKIKHITSKRTKAIYKYSRKIINKVIMTGTPSTNKLEDVFGLVKFLDDGERLGTSIYNFKQKYYEQIDKWQWELKKDSAKIVRNKIKDITFTKKLIDCIEMPAQVFIIKEAQSTNEQNKYYKMVKDWEITYKGVTNYIDFAVSKMIKMMQISSGFIYNEDRVLNFPSGKQELLVQLLTEDLNDKNKIVIWCNFIEEFNIIENLLKVNKLGKYVSYKGDNKQQAREDFLKNSNIRFFIGQETSGLGMNELIVADTTIYFSNSWKLEARLQSQARTWRIGSHIHSKVLYIDLITKDSVDELILECIKANKNILDILMSTPEKIFNRR